MNLFRQTPFPILIGIGFFWLFAAGATAVAIFTIIEAVYMGGVKNYQLFGRLISDSQFLIFISSLSSLTTIITIGLRRRWPTSRYLALAFLLAFISFLILQLIQDETCKISAVIPIFLAIYISWHLLKRDSSATYFDAGFTQKKSSNLFIKILFLSPVILAVSPIIYFLIIVGLEEINVVIQSSNTGLMALGWLMLFTIPIGGILFLINLVIIFFLTRNRDKRIENLKINGTRPN